MVARMCCGILIVPAPPPRPLLLLNACPSLAAPLLAQTDGVRRLTVIRWDGTDWTKLGGDRALAGTAAWNYTTDWLGVMPDGSPILVFKAGGGHACMLPSAARSERATATRMQDDNNSGKIACVRWTGSAWQVRRACVRACSLPGRGVQQPADLGLSHPRTQALGTSVSNNAGINAAIAVGSDGSIYVVYTVRLPTCAQRAQLRRAPSARCLDPAAAQPLICSGGVWHQCESQEVERGHLLLDGPDFLPWHQPCGRVHAGAGPVQPPLAVPHRRCLLLAVSLLQRSCVCSGQGL